MKCPCDKLSAEECGICNDQTFSGETRDLLKVIWEQKEIINKLKYDNELKNGKLHIIKTVMGADK